jgi:hypothetical protein
MDADGINLGQPHEVSEDVRGLIESIKSAVNNSLYSDQPSQSTCSKLLEGISEFMDSIKNTRDKGSISDYSVGGFWSIIDTVMDKTGRSFLIEERLNGDAEEKGTIRKVEFHNRKVGPHRPRRISKKILRYQLNITYMDYYVTPVIPMNYVNMTINVESPQITQWGKDHGRQIKGA